MNVEILHIGGCPNWGDTAAHLTTILAEVDPASRPVRVTLIASPDDAARVPFAGSPTVLIDGADAFPSAGRTADLACRVYPVNGRLAGAPSIDDLRTVISAALASTA
jgi:hypothetical protein